MSCYTQERKRSHLIEPLGRMVELVLPKITPLIFATEQIFTRQSHYYVSSSIQYGVEVLWRE